MIICGSNWSEMNEKHTIVIQTKQNIYKYKLIQHKHIIMNSQSVVVKDSLKSTIEK